MSPVLPLIIINGMVMGFVSASFFHLLPPNTNNDQNISIALICFGIGAMLGGSVAGFLVDKIGIRKTGKLSFILYEVVLLIVVMLLNVNEVFWVCVIGLMLGICISTEICYMMVVCTSIYKGKLEAFAVNKQMMVTFYCIYQWVVVSLNNEENMKRNMLMEIIFIMVLNLVGLLIFSKCLKDTEKEKEI